jgi:hypothetical protein
MALSSRGTLPLVALVRFSGRRGELRPNPLGLHAALQRFEQFELPAPGEREREMVRSFWDLEVLREREEQSSSRAMMFESKREELEACEPEQAEVLRSGS